MTSKLSMFRPASVPRIAAAVIAIAAAVIFCALELTGIPSGQFPNLPELRAEHHTVPFALHGGIEDKGMMAKALFE